MKLLIVFYLFDRNLKDEIISSIEDDHYDFYSDIGLNEEIESISSKLV